jgi:hypothetical protein
MARSEMHWEMGFSASEIASTAFSNPKIFRSPAQDLNVVPGICLAW